jgi:hypothetical protein
VTAWSGHAQVRLAGGDHQQAVHVDANTAARAAQAAVMDAVETARQVYGSEGGEVIEVGLSISREGA